MSLFRLFKKETDRSILARAKKMENELRAEWLKRAKSHDGAPEDAAQHQLYAAVQALAWLSDGMKSPLDMIRDWYPDESAPATVTLLATSAYESA